MVVLTRELVRPHMARVTVAPITTTVRGLSTEIPVGPANGLDKACVVSCDNIVTVPKGAMGPPDRLPAARAGNRPDGSNSCGIRPGLSQLSGLRPQRWQLRSRPRMGTRTGGHAHRHGHGHGHGRRSVSARPARQVSRRQPRRSSTGRRDWCKRGRSHSPAGRRRGYRASRRWLAAKSGGAAARGAARTSWSRTPPAHRHPARPAAISPAVLADRAAASPARAVALSRRPVSPRSAGCRAGNTDVARCW